MILLLYAALVRHCLQYCVQLWDPQHKKDVNLLEQVQRQDTKIITGLEHLSYGQAQRPGVLHPGKAKRDLIAAFLCLNRSYK